MLEIESCCHISGKAIDSEMSLRRDSRDLSSSKHICLVPPEPRNKPDFLVNACRQEKRPWVGESVQIRLFLLGAGTGLDKKVLAHPHSATALSTCVGLCGAYSLWAGKFVAKGVPSVRFRFRGFGLAEML